MKFLVTHRRWVIGAFVVLALLLLLWFIGPLIGIGEARPLESTTARVVATLLVLALWLGGEALRWWLGRRREKALVDAIASDSEASSQSRAEAAELATRFREAMATLAKRKLGGGRMLYQLPWYMFIGAPGSGKTTSLVNSGLRFPLAKPGDEQKLELRGVGGTRNCDWMFTDDAVLIDTAGRYVTQDSNAQVDQSAWKTFLKLLKKHRPRQPINGIIATLSVDHLVAGDGAELRHVAQQMRLRIEELQQELGLQFPVYLMVTKCDLISGFTEFFAALEAPQREQVWGMTFDFDPARRTSPPLKQSFEVEFPLLVERLNQWMLKRLSEERDVDRRAAMYPFPQQFAALGPQLAEFLDIAFGSSRLTQPALVRGLYFTSGTQFGTPIDRVMLGIARSLDLRGNTARANLATGAAKSFFIRSMLSQVVFPEAGLAGHSEAREASLRRLNWGLLAAVAVLGIGLSVAWTVSFFNNRDGLARAAGAARQAAQHLAEVPAAGTDDMPQLLVALDGIRRIPPAVHDPVQSPPWSFGLGLYQGEKVADHAGERYRLALQQGLLPRLALQLESVMNAPQARPEQVYAALKTYLMLYDGRRMDPRWFSGAVADLWRSRLDAAVASQAQTHLDALVAGGDLQVARFHSRNDTLVAAARGRVAEFALADRAYAMLRLSASQGEGVRLSEVVGAAGVSVLERTGTPLTTPIPSLFTVDGWRNQVKPQVGATVRAMADEEQWVLGDRASGVGRSEPAQIAQEVQRRYFKDYKAAWQGALAEIQLRPLAGLREAQLAAQALAQSDSPLKKLVNKVAEQTRLTAPPSVADKAASAVQKQVQDKAANAVSGLFGSQSGAVVAAAVSTDATARLERELEAEFSDVHRLAGDGKTGEIDQVLATLNNIATELGGLQRKIAAGMPMAEVPPGLADALSGASRYPPPLSSIIKTLASVGDEKAKGGIRGEMKAAMGGAAAMCKRSLPGKYPFKKDAALDVGVQDFVGVFKAGGELDAFFKSRLEPLVDRSGPAWRLKASATDAPPVSAAALRQFQNADVIRTAFLAGGASAQVTVDLSVVAADGELTLDYDGTQHKLKTGSTVRLAWPGRPGVKLALGSSPLAAAEGAWALFRLIDKGQIDPVSAGDRVRLSYTAGNGAKVTLDLRTGSASYNPFRLRELEGFACPQD